MLIIITGAIGSGKTTVCRKLVELLRNRGYACHGILTSKGADQSIIIEDIKSGEKTILASVSNSFSGPSTVKYSFNPQGIDFGIKAMSTYQGILVIDEMGQLELRGEGFAGILKLIKDRSIKNCILVIRSWLLPAYLPQLPDKPLVFETTAENRNQLAETIALALGIID